MERALIRCRQVRFGYDGGPPILEAADLEIPPGLSLVTGVNGAGKTTLLKLLAGVERPDAGTVEIDGRDLWIEEESARRRLAYLPEQPDLSPYATIEEILLLVSRLRGEPDGAAAAALARCGLEALRRRSVRELSMGQRRRALLAAAMIGAPAFLLLDEPLDSMDRAMRSEVLSWIEGHRAAGSTIVIVTHEIEPFAASASRSISIRGGRTLLHDPLPDDPAARAALLDALARGTEAAGSDQEGRS